MKIGIISGSQRANSQSAKVGRYLCVELEKAHSDLDTYFLDLGETPLPSFDDSFWSDMDTPLHTSWEPVSAELQSCDGFVVIVPEWHGMVPPSMKNFLLYCTVAETGNKPGLIVTTSASIGGSYPVAELRISGTKNNRLCWIPDHVIVRNVGKVLNVQEQSESDQDAAIRQRLAHSSNLLVAYSQALISVREAGVADYQTYGFGM